MSSFRTMTSSSSNNRLDSFYQNSFHLHRMNDSDDLNLYYQKFLNKLSKISLKIFLPLLPLIYLFTLFLCRLFLSNQSIHRFDFRTISSLVGIFATFVLLFLIRLHTKWKTLWFCTRIFLILLLILPLILTYQTEQNHILFSTISITLIYSLLTFTLIQSLLICFMISILHLSLVLNTIHWQSFEFLSMSVYHLLINLAGLSAYIQSMKHIRQHFHAYERHLYEKNQFHVDCKKLNTINGHCQQPQRLIGRMSKLSNGFNLNGQTTMNFNRKFGTVINCNLSLNDQTRNHTCDELASLFDVLYCQMEQLILKYQPQGKYFFDNETIVILIFNEHDQEEITIDSSCRLAIELFRFIQHVNHVTQWSITAIIGIDYNELNVYSAEYSQGLAYDYARWLREECLIVNRIHVSSRIYQSLNENKFYEFHSYGWLNPKNPFENTSTYFLFSTNMYEPQQNHSTAMKNSSLIDQLTRIQAQYHVEKHLGTITLTRSLRKRSLMELTNRHLNWLSLNFKEQQVTNDQNLHTDFQSTHRANRPNMFLYLFALGILAGSLCQSFVIDHLTLYYLILYPGIILLLLFLVVLFLYTMNTDQTQLKFNINKTHRKFYVYLNQMICLTLSTLFLVAIQYHSIENFKYLFPSNEHRNGTRMNESSSQNHSTIIGLGESSSSFDRRYHEYLVLSPIYPLYLCLIYRQCSWILKTFFIISSLIVQLCLLEYIWLTTNSYFPSITPLHHYTAFTLIIFHGLLLIISSYVREWLEKLDFVWLKQIDHDRLTILRQRDELIKQTSLYLPLRAIDYYLRSDSDLALSQHYHLKYDRMALLFINFYPTNLDDEYFLVDYLNDVEYLLKNNEKYLQIVLHRKSNVKELMFSMDINCQDSMKYLQQLVELLFQINERLKQISSAKIHLSACLHIAPVNEILIHLEKYPKIEIWSEHISLIQLLISKTQINHCLTTASVYHLLHNMYLFRTAGSIVNTQVNTENNTNVYYLLGRLIGDNLFQGRNALPLTIGQTSVGTVQKSSSTDDSHRSQSSQDRCKLNSHQQEQNQIQTSTTTTTTTTSSSVIINEQQSLLKQSSASSRKHVRISNHMEHPSYRHTLLQALNNSTNINNTNTNTNGQHPISPIKKLSNRLLPKKQTPSPVPKDFYVPRMIHLSDNSCWSSREAMTQSETSGSKCLILTQQMLNGSTDDNSRCKSTPPPPLLPPNALSSNRHFSAERKSFTEEDFRQLIQDQSSKDNHHHHPARSLSTTNEETTSSFSGWDDIPPSPLPSVKSNQANNQSQSDSVKSPIVDCYYPRRPCDLAFTVNMTTEDDNSSRTETKSTVIASPTSTVITITSPLPQPPTANITKPVVVSPHPPPLLPPLLLSPPQHHQQQMPRYRPAPFNLARKLVAETSESALSEISVDHQHEPWRQNIVYQSKYPQRTRLSSSYSNLHDLLHLNESSKYLPKPNPSPTLIQSDLLQRWLEDQLNLFRHQVKQTPPLSTRKSNRLSNNIVIQTDSTDDESDTVSENTFTALTNQSKSISSNKRPYNHVRYKPLRKNSSNPTSHLVRHESLKHRNRPLSFENNSQSNRNFLHYHSNQMKKLPRRTDSSSMPHSDLSDISSSRPDNLSESVISNLESEYDNIYTQPINSNAPTTIMSNSQILSDEDDDDETTLATTITATTINTTANRCYF